MKFLGKNLYQHGEIFHYRFFINGVRTTRSLDAINITEARAEGRAKQSAHNRSKLGLCVDPFAPKAEDITIAILAEEYAKAGYPDRKLKPRTKGLVDIVRHVAILAEYFGPRQPDTITPADCDKYHAARTAEITKGRGGHSSVDKELITFNAILNYAVRKERIKYNPLLGRTPRFVSRCDVRNCNSVMPANDEELHTIANALFANPESEVLGWQLLLEAMTGCRTSEILDLRWDAKRLSPTLCAPGCVDGTLLWVKRRKKGICPWVMLEPVPGMSPLAELLRALAHWHRQRYPHNPWFLPGKESGAHVHKNSLTHALTRVCQSLGLPHRTSHGLRAYFVRVLRGLGINDSEIAKRLGQSSGDKLILDVYGIIEPGLSGSRLLDWSPSPESKITPAWRQWLPETTPNIIPLEKTA